ncbi:MAG: hypothetical protein K8R39_05615 [Arcobacteraceae bacterium]|nr:hypothetical protein [Arcobacteraceae bacterium]
MNAIIAVQDLIKQNQKRIKILQQQLDDHNSGKSKLSIMGVASTENGIEKSQEALEKNQMILNELMKHDIQEIEKEERLKEAIKRKNYFKYQKIRLKRDISRDNDQKLEAMMIVDELPADINLEDDDLFSIAETTIKLDLRIHDELDDELEEIKEDFAKLLKNVSKEDISKLGVLNTHIPVLVLHLSVLISNIKDIIKEEELPEFKGLPKFEDWWIEELWSNHQAYFGLYKWKQIIFSLCITSEQKRAWEVIFSNWIFIKKVLNKKRKLGFEYNFAFDTLLKYHTELEEELEVENLKNMENIIHQITQKEDFLSYKKSHNIITPYLEFKWSKLNLTSPEEKKD